MRWHLLNTFDKIYVIDLHGNAKKKEVAPDGSKDENVFDIQQGVSINIFVRTSSKKKRQLGKVYIADMWGTRELKTNELFSTTIEGMPWTEFDPAMPAYLFKSTDDLLRQGYHEGILIGELFPMATTGFVTGRDGVATAMSFSEVESNMAFVAANDDYAIRQHFGLKDKDARDWTVPSAKKDVLLNYSPSRIVQCSYRPFDHRYTFYSGQSRGMYASPQRKVMQHFITQQNTGLAWIRPMSSAYNFSVFISSRPLDQCYAGNKSAGAGITYTAPLYLYPETTKQTKAISQSIQPNLDAKLVEQLAKGIGLSYRFDANDLWAHGTGQDLTPLDVLDYCYAVLHGPAYREKYKEFLKSDFPRIPFPHNLPGKSGEKGESGEQVKKFRALVQLGARLRSLHLLEDPQVDRFITKYPAPGDNTITRKMTAKSIGFEATGGGVGKVWINDSQYFANVPEMAWNFYIGGYQPAQKWLKDRHGRQLTFDDIRHYQRMIVALTETARCMEEVDRVGVV